MKLSNHFNLGLLYLMLLSCSGNNEIEASIKFYDPEQHDYALQAFDAKSMPYRVATDGQIFYLYKYKETVDQVRAEIFGKSVLEPPRGVIVKGVDAPRVSELLVEAEIPYESLGLEGSDQVSFSWNHEVNEAAMNIVSRVVAPERKAQ